MGIHLKSTKEFFIIESYDEEEEEFIEMEILASPCCSYNTKKEFEFQLLPTLNDQHHKASADELFCNGKLLPLETINSKNNNTINAIKLCHQQEEEDDEQFVDFDQVFLQPFSSTNTPYISPPESCRVSCELFEHDHSLFQAVSVNGSKKSSLSSSSWSTKLKHKLIKVSRSYLKSLFLFPQKSSSNAKKSTRGESYNENHEAVIGFRKSFSGVVQWHNCCSVSSITSFGGSGTHSNSSSSSFSSSFSSFSLSLNSSHSLCYDLQCLNRFSSSSFELETPIDGAIAHCKQSCTQLCA